MISATPGNGFFRNLGIASICLLAIAGVSSCDWFNPVRKASLELILSATVRARTTIQPADLEVAAYDISGIGPEGATFSATGVNSSITTYTQTDLVPGDWTVTATGKNASGTVLVRSSPVAVTLLIGQKNQVSINCVPIPGNGTFSLNLSWPANSIQTPAIVATLTPNSGGATAPLTFTISGDSASYTSPEPLPNGYYTLSIKLLDPSYSNNFSAYSAVHLVLIYADQTSIANWTLVPSDISLPPAYGLALTLTSDTNSPIAINLYGYYNELQVGTGMMVYALGTPEPDSWQWYLDGDPIVGETGSSVWVGDTLISGTTHNLSVVAQKGSIAGSKTIQFKIVTALPKGVTTLAGSGLAGSTNGIAALATFAGPTGIAVDVVGNTYIADTNNNKIRKLSAAGKDAGMVTTFAGGFSASLYSPMGLAVDVSGNLYVADTLHNTIRKISSSGTVTTLAGSGSIGSADGLGTAASFYYPSGVAVDTDGNVYVADSMNQKIRKITPAGDVSTLAGSGAIGFTDGTGTAASFFNPTGLAVDAAGTVYVADTYNEAVRRISPAGVVTTYAGSGSIGSADGTGTSASFYYPAGLAVDSSGSLYAADSYNNTIRKISAARIVTTIAGTGQSGSLDGAGLVATFAWPVGVAVDASGVVYIADTNNNKIRKIVP